MDRWIVAAALGLIAGQAVAQAAPPIGMWQGETSGDILLVQADGSCSTSGMVDVAGTCSWNPTATGGVLTLTYPWTAGPANIYYNVTWLDGSTILLNSVERFFRVQ